MTITVIMMVIIIKYFFIPFKGKSNIKKKYTYKRLSFKSAQQHTGKVNTSSIIKQNIYILLMEVHCKLKSITQYDCSIIGTSIIITVLILSDRTLKSKLLTHSSYPFIHTFTSIQSHNPSHTCTFSRPK